MKRQSNLCYSISLFLLFFFFLIGCARMQHPTYNSYVASTDFNKYRKIAILPFADAPNKPQTGLIVQGLACNVFSRFGFHVAERAQMPALLNEKILAWSGLAEDQVRTGRLLGVNAIVVGEVAQFESIVIRGVQPTYNPSSNQASGAAAFVDGFMRGYERAQARDRIENYVAISLRIIDVETGALIYAGSSQFERGYANSTQSIAETLLQYIVSGWINPGHVEEARKNKERLSIKKLQAFEDFKPKLQTN